MFLSHVSLQKILKLGRGFFELVKINNICEFIVLQFFLDNLEKEVGKIPKFLKIVLTKFGFESAGSFIKLDDASFIELFDAIEAEINIMMADSRFKTFVQQYLRFGCKTFSLGMGHKFLIRYIREYLVEMNAKSMLKNQSAKKQSEKKSQVHFRRK